jgi:GNAT superfamily N-acetyltransferase
LSYRIREVKGTAKNIDTLKALHQLTFYSYAPQPDYTKGFWWLAQLENEAVAFIGIEPSILGIGIGYFNRVGVLHPHRGNGLQQKLMRAMEAKAKRQGWYRIVTDTTDNVASANNIISGGYKLFVPDNPWSFENSLYWTKTIH